MSLFPNCFDCMSPLARPHPSRPSTCERCKHGPRGGSRAGNLVQKAIRAGYLPHPTTRLCEDCGEQAQCYDHRDYNRPLMVEAVCTSCNHRRGPATRWWVAAEQHRRLSRGDDLWDVVKWARDMIKPEARAEWLKANKSAARLARFESTN